MAKENLNPMPEGERCSKRAAHSLDQALTRAVRYSSYSSIQQLVRSPLRMAATRIANAVALEGEWSIPITTRTFWGAKIRIRIPEPISNQLFSYGFFEPGLTAFMLRILGPGDKVLDVGAHYGYFTLLAADLVGMEGEVHAFEPMPDTFDVLKGNVRDRRNIVANELAAWSQRQNLSVLDLGPRLSAFNTVFSPRLRGNGLRRQSSKRISVSAVSLDDYCSERALWPNFVKVDAESAEHHILQGMKWVLSEPRPFVSLEVGDFDLPDVPTSAELVRSMVLHDYVALEYVYGDIELHTPRDSYVYDNLLFGPSEHSLVEHIRKLSTRKRGHLD
jgi:FkbM family methyltransferase